VNTTSDLSCSLAPRTLDDAPAPARAALERLRASVGAIPNLAGAMANSPALIEAFVAMRDAFARSSLRPLEREVLALTNAVENGCRYCQAIHATFGAASGLAEADIEALRAGRDPADPRLSALARLTRQVLATRGAVPPEEVERFLAAGFEPAGLLDVILAAALSTVANYSGRLLRPEPDEALRARYR